MRSLRYCGGAVLFLCAFFSVACDASLGGDVGTEGFGPKPFVPGTTDTSLMGRSERLRLLSSIEIFAEAYLAEVSRVSWLTFRNREDLPADQAVSLFSEARDFTGAMRSILDQVPQIREDPFSLRSWVVIAREVSLMMPYMDDLNNKSVVKSQDYIGIRLLMPEVFDRIIVADLRLRP